MPASASLTTTSKVLSRTSPTMRRIVADDGNQKVKLKSLNFVELHKIDPWLSFVSTVGCSLVLFSFLLSAISFFCQHHFLLTWKHSKLLFSASIRLVCSGEWLFVSVYFCRFSCSACPSDQR
ncbi:hypothetical protein F5878DRAFT_275828 [Lentinula raphanica]|uniref:Uncharacterized protein n=1 Tax=Lentinula raphanica TaxID=153919 RepID=A0AA38UIY3_9AGAR|nr:hypothetical protein F5878DRAFT_275828 [Lentinula raphanica]